jgi:Domain of unknown function (DUF4249)
MKKATIFRLYLLGIILGLSVGCITPYEPEGLEQESNILVIEGSIIAPYGTQIKLSRTMPLTRSDSTGSYYSNEGIIENATVTVITDDGQTVAEAKAIPGEVYYEVKDSLSYQPDKKYAIHIRINNKEYQSEFVEPQITPEIDEVNFLYKELQQVDIRVSTHDNRPNGTRYYRWKYEEDWEIRSEYFASYIWDGKVIEPVTLNNPKNLYYCWQKNVSNNFILVNTTHLTENKLKDHTILTIPKYNSKLSYLYSILVRQYALDKEAFEYFQNIQKNIESAGGLFAPQPSEIKGNITCLTNPDEPVIGYINATTETTYRLYIKAYELPGMEDYYDCRERIFCLTDKISNAYGQGKAILKQQEKDLYECINIRCVDCTSRGGTKNKPAFWPNDHQ